MKNDDDGLIKEIKGGSVTAFDQLMLRYQDYVYRIAYGFGKNRQNAMDISQVVFLKTYEKLNSFRGKCKFKTWIGKIAYNEGINWHKKNKRYIQLSNIEDIEMNEYYNNPQNDEIIAKENKALLLKSLLNLNTKYRLAVVLRYFNDTPVKEISGIIGCSEGVVKNMLHRSINQLRENLGKQIFEG